MVDHARAQELAAISVDFDLTPIERAEVDAHLAACTACRAFVDGLLADARAIAELPRIDAPAAVRERVLGERRAGPSPVRWATAIAAVLVVAVGVAIGTRWIPFGGSSGAAAPSEPIAAASQPPEASAAPPASQAPAASEAPPSATPGLPQVAWVAAPDQPAFQPETVVPSATAAPTPPPDGGDTSGPSPAEAAMEAGLALEDGILAVGHGCRGPGPVTCQADAWRSSDGRAWTAVPSDAVLDAGADIDEVTPTGMLDITDGGPGVIAVGAARGADRIEAAVWVSTDGGTWERASVARQEGDAWMEAVSGSRLGYIAVGEVIVDGEVRAAAWTSADGIDWRPAEVAAPDLGDHRPEDPMRAGVFDVVAVDAGLVAVGAECPKADDPCRPAVWASTDDAATWDRQAIDLGDGRMLAVTAIGDALVAVGDSGMGSELGLIWRSDEGDEWTIVDADAGPPLYAVLALPGGIVVGGQGAVLGSLDARTWERMDDAALVDGTVLGFVDTGSAVVALGYRSPPDEEFDRPPAAWVLDVDDDP